MRSDPLDFFEKHSLTPRAEQIHVLEQLRKNWSKYRAFCINAPTGVGKTFIATALADSLESSYVLTSTHQLQEQYEESWDELVNLKGRSNYICALNPSFNVASAPCNLKAELKKNCKSNCICPYYNAKKAALASKAMITNPPFLLYSTHCGFAREGSSEWNMRDALIIDEAHALEDHLVSFAASDIDIERLEKMYSIDLSECKFADIPGDYNYKVAQKLTVSLMEKCEAYQSLLTKELSKHKAPGGDLGKWASTFTAAHGEIVGAISKKHEALDKVLQPLKMFFLAQSSFAEAEKKWVVHKVPGKNAIKISPIYASFLFEKHFGKLAEKFVFMSATLGSKDAFCKELGIKPSECLYIDCACPFPPENSPIIVLPSIKLSKDVYEANVAKLGPLVDKILDEHPGVRGIIHCVNYAIQQEIYKRVSRKNQGRLTCRDMIAHSPGSAPLKNVDLLELHSKKKDSVLLSPSMTTGVDLKDDLSVFQIIVKMPWGNLGDPRIKKKAEIDSDWYTNNCWKSMVQACGRSTRHDKDESITYILDSNFNFFFQKWSKNLPRWFIDRIHM